MEESLAFAERAAEELSGEIAELGRAVRTLEKRLAAVEEKLVRPEAEEDVE